MAKATSKSGMGSGWHKQSGRHSMARKTGHAGGKYVRTEGGSLTYQYSKPDYTKDKLYFTPKSLQPEKKEGFPPYTLKEYNDRAKHYWKFPNGKPAPNSYVWDGYGWIHNSLDKKYSRDSDGDGKEVGSLSKGKTFRPWEKLSWQEQEYFQLNQNIDNPKEYDAYMKSFGMKKDSDGDGVPDSKDCKPHDPTRQGTNQQVAEAFIQGKSDSAGSLRTSGNTIYSYGTMIGYKKDDGTIVLNKTKYSQTTSIHQGLIRRANTGKIEELPEKEFNEAYGKKVTEDYKKPRDFQSTDQILPSKTIDISAVKERNDKGGYHFFERSNMRFFNSKVNRNAYVDKKAEKAYFVTSEKHDDYYNNIHQPRKFTVRKVDLKTGNVDTAGEFQAYTDNKTATKVAKDLAQQ